MHAPGVLLHDLMACRLHGTCELIEDNPFTPSFIIFQTFIPFFRVEKIRNPYGKPRGSLCEYIILIRLFLCLVTMDDIQLYL